jgi:hypothetical protein
MTYVILNFFLAIFAVIGIVGISALVASFSDEVLELKGKQLGWAVGGFWSVIVALTIVLSVLPQ